MQIDRYQRGRRGGDQRRRRDALICLRKETRAEEVKRNEQKRKQIKYFPRKMEILRMIEMDFHGFLKLFANSEDRNWSRVGSDFSQPLLRLRLDLLIIVKLGGGVEKPDSGYL